MFHLSSSRGLSIRCCDGIKTYSFEKVFKGKVRSTNKEWRDFQQFVCFSPGSVDAFAYSCLLKKLFWNISWNSHSPIVFNIVYRLWHGCFPLSLAKFSRTAFCRARPRGYSRKKIKVRFLVIDLTTFISQMHTFSQCTLSLLPEKVALGTNQLNGVNNNNSIQ